MDRFAKYRAISDTLRGQICELELVAPLTFADGTVQEVVNLRRAMCKKASRRGNVTVLEFADVDRSALEQIFPFETFTTADYPGIYVEHVGKRVPQGVGTLRKVPAAYISKTAGVYTYAGPKVLPAGIGAILAVYRGTTPGQGALVDPSEYLLSIYPTPSGYFVHTIIFTREQVDFSGRPYVIEADWAMLGSRSPSDEIARILALYGLTVDAASFAAAAAADIAAGFLVDPLYGDPGRTGNATIEDLLRVARGYISQTSTGAWAIVQDVAKASVAQFDTSVQNDLCELTEYGDGDIPKTVQIQGRPRISGKDGDYAVTLPPRAIAKGSSGQTQLKYLYVDDATVLDKLASYWQKRLNTLRVAKGTIYAAQLASGAVISITDAVNYVGSKDFIATGISRPAFANAVTLREYDPAVYVYTPGVLPADATNGYAPDYTYTPPLAPAFFGLAATSVSADNDGKQTAFASMVVVPPANANWARLMVQLTDTTTNEQYQGEAILFSPGVYVATIPGLRPNRVHSALTWAVNANNIDGATLALVPNFTSASAAIALAAPTLSIAQKQSFYVDIDFGPVADVAGQPKFRRYVLFEKVGAGAFAEVLRTADRSIKRQVVHGTAYQWKSHAEDLVSNETGDSNTISFTPAAVIDDTHVVGSSLTGGSIANSSINQGRSFTGTGSQTGTVPAGSSVGVGGSGNKYSFMPHLAVDIGPLCDLQADPGGSPPDDSWTVNIFNPSGGSTNYYAKWRLFNP